MYFLTNLAMEIIDWLKDVKIFNGKEMAAMDKNKLVHFTKKLLTEYERVQKELGYLQTDIAELEGTSLVTEYEEKSSIEEQKDYILNFLTHDAAELKEIQLALQKTLDGTYGICERCGQTIEEDRLEAVPTGRYCKKCEEELEKEQR
ncbi:general stress protein 16O [bacterium BMS3Bbin03]|nr:general stress protein 16O [bacterium BMS3Bbin03]